MEPHDTIQSKNDLKRFIQADLSRRNLRKPPLFYQYRKPIIHFTLMLRKAEYLKNTAQGPLGTLRWKIAAIRLKRYGAKLGFTIAMNTFGPGLYLMHWGSIVISSSSRIGANCTVHSCVNIGANGSNAPKLGHNVYLGPGAKLFGKITLGDNVMVGANAVVNKSFPDNVTIVGVPAKVVSRQNNA